MWRNDDVWHSYGPAGSCGAETEVLSSVEKLRDQGIKWIVKRGIGALRRMLGAWQKASCDSIWRKGVG